MEIEGNIDSVQMTHVGIEAMVLVDRSRMEIGVILGAGFIAMVLFAEVMMTIFQSISNAGQLNVISVVIAVSIDQLIVRIFVGGVIVGVGYVLEKMGSMLFADSVVLRVFCEEQMRK